MTDEELSAEEDPDRAEAEAEADACDHVWVGDSWETQEVAVEPHRVILRTTTHVRCRKCLALTDLR